MTTAARLGQATVILIVVAWLLSRAVRHVQRRRAVLERQRGDFLDHLRRSEEP